MTEINPVTEPEVMSFAQRIVTTIVSVSQQARDIDSLRTRMENIVTEFNKLRDENDKLKSEVSEAWVFVKTVEAERDQAKRNAELSEARVAEAQQDAARAYDKLNQEKENHNNTISNYTVALNQKDARINELEHALAEANNAHQETMRHNASLKATNEEQAFRIVKQGESLHHRQETIDRLSIELHDCAQSLNASNTKLGSVQAKLNDLRSLFDSPKEVMATEPQDNIRAYTAF